MKPCSWTIFDSGLVLQQSTTICTCHVGQFGSGAALFWPKLGVSLAENVVVDLKYHVWFPSQSSQPWLWTNFDARMLLLLSPIMRKYNLGQTSPQTVCFLPNVGASLAVKGVFGQKYHVRFPSWALSTLLVNQFCRWSAPAAVCNHAPMWFGLTQPWSCSFLAKTGGQLGRKGCAWL